MTDLASEVDRYSAAHADLVAQSITNEVVANLRYQRSLRSHDHILAAAIRTVASARHWNLETHMTTPTDKVAAAIADAERVEDIRNGAVELTPAEVVAHALGKDA